MLTTNEVEDVVVGDSQYTYLLDTHGIPLDDLMIYRLAEAHYLVVVNASNNDKNWAWLNAVKQGDVCIDPAASGTPPGKHRSFYAARSACRKSGADRRVDIALQGPDSKKILFQLSGSEEDKARVRALGWAGRGPVTLGGYDLIVSRTGYTGERVAYELFVHPDQAAALFRELVNLGAVPCGLAARDSLRIEAGLPLYGHELAGPLNLNPADAGFSNYVRLLQAFLCGQSRLISPMKTTVMPRSLVSGCLTSARGHRIKAIP